MAIADRITVLRDGVTVSTVERAAFDRAALLEAMMSQDPERSAGPEEVDERVGGLAGVLRSLFFGRGQG
jgi:ABC-type sugar transport system ATPase subunit